jgi:hypothetical protein
MKNEMNTKLKELGKKLKMSETDMKNILQNRRKIIVTSAVVIIALAFASNIYYLGKYYGGVSIEDFLNRFRLLRFLFGLI